MIDPDLSEPADEYPHVNTSTDILDENDDTLPRPSTAEELNNESDSDPHQESPQPPASFSSPARDNFNNFNNFNHYLMERLQREIELRSLEDEQLNSVLLASREEFDATDAIEKNESAVLNSSSQKYSSIKIKKKREELCCICMEHFSCNQEVYWLSCTHIFHNKCLDEWVRYKNECPTCRNTIGLK